VDSAQEHRPCLIVEADDHSGGWEFLQVAAGFLAPAKQTSLVKQTSKCSINKHRVTSHNFWTNIATYLIKHPQIEK
jgi:hypothetical protein